MNTNVQPLPVKSRFRPDTAKNILPILQNNDAAEQLRAQGLPTQLLERFKFTNVAQGLKNINFINQDPQTHLSSDEFCVSNNVKFDYGQSEPSLWALTKALPSRDLFLTFPKNKKISQPLYLNWADHVGNVQTLNVKIKVEEGADVFLIEKHASKNNGWKNQSVEIDIAPNARLVHVRFLDDGFESASTTVIGAHVARDARYECLTLNMGAAWSRHEYHMRLNGTNGFAGLYGVNLLKGKQFSDSTILIEHTAPYCQSSQFFRNLLDDEAHGVFQGKIHVHQVAQKTDGYQLCNNILLSSQAVMNVKPELEIYADDVKCSHGTTTGALDETPLFYLRSRGIPEKQARQLLIESFVGEVLDKIDNESVRHEMNEKIFAWLS